MEKQYTEAFWDPIMKIVKELAQALYALVPLSEVRQKDRWICMEDTLRNTVEREQILASLSYAKGACFIREDKIHDKAKGCRNF